MNPVFQIVKCIVQNNPWKKVPQRLCEAFYFQCHKRLSKNVLTKQLFNGRKIYLYPNNPIASSFVYMPIPDRQEITILREKAEQGSIFLDIGANIGAYSLLMHDKVKEVYAFEAHPKTATFCRLNFKLNKMSTSNVLSYAVSEDNQAKNFTDLNCGNPTNSRASVEEDSIKVPAITLDEFVQQRKWTKETPFLIKIDVEGYEHEVFNGAKYFLKNFNIKAIIFENFSSQQEAILKLLHNLGYQTQAIGKHNTLAVPLKEKQYAS